MTGPEPTHADNLPEQSGLPESVEEAEAQLQQINTWLDQMTRQIPLARERAGFLTGFIMAKQEQPKPNRAARRAATRGKPRPARSGG